MRKTCHILKEAFFALVWAIMIAFIIMSPGVFNNAVDFVYANF